MNDTMNVPGNNDETPDREQDREQNLGLQIERLREQFPHTQDLYREVCVLMFFRHGTTPTANKLYQLVRKGSMSAPAEALSAFWDNLREKSRVRIEHPDLPPALKTAAGELTATLWSTARQLADEALAECRLEARDQVDAAGAALVSMQLERDAIELRLQDQASINAQALRRIGALEHEAAALTQTNLALAEQLQQARQQVQQSKEQLRQAKEQEMAQQMAQQQIHQQQLQDARREFTADLDQLRAANQLANERSLAVETRALLEIDRERTIAARLQKELDAVRTSSIQAALQADLRHRQDVDTLQTQLGDQKQQGGVLQGQLQAALTSQEAIAQELKATQAQSIAAATEASSMRVTSENWQRRCEEAQRLQAQLQLTTKAGRAYRKSRTD